jgi:regulatory protein
MARRGRVREEPRDIGADLGPPADPTSVARTIVLNKLTAQARSRHELAEVLAAKNVPSEIATEVLDRFEEVGLIDDKAFATAWIESRQSTRGLARRALAFELRRKGIDEELVKQSVASIDTDHEVELARAIVQRKLRATRGLDPHKRIRRLAGVLARKGYPPDVCIGVVKDAVATDEQAHPHVPAPAPGRSGDLVD